MTFLMILGGLILLFAGGEALVSGSVSVARRLNISELVIGLTLVGFGTSVPELVTSLRAIGQDAVGIAVGNVVGSNIANILLVLGVAAMIRPILTNPRALLRDGSFMVGVTLILCTLIYYDWFSRPVGFALVVLLVIYMSYSVLADKGNAETASLHEEEGESFSAEHGLGMGLLLTALGLAGVVFGARFLVDGSVIVARDFGVSEAVIGLSIVAIGTSLPELATSAIAAFKGKSDVALGNILGSNIFNVLGIVGVTAIVHPFSIMREANAVEGDIAGNAMEPAVIMESMISWEHIGALILSVLLLWLFAFSGRKLARWEGAVMLAAYALYMGMLFNLVPVPALIPNV